MTTFFNLDNIHHSVANAVRRGLIQHISGEAFDMITVTTNTSILDSEMLKHRVRLIPVSGTGAVTCTAKNTSATLDLDVTSDMFTHGPGVTVWPGVFLVRLCPGEEVNLSAQAVPATAGCQSIIESPSFVQARTVTFCGKVIQEGDVAQDDRLLDRMPELYGPHGLELTHFLYDYNLHGAVNVLLGHRVLEIVEGNCFTIGVKMVGFGDARDVYRQTIYGLMNALMSLHVLITLGDRQFKEADHGVMGMLIWAYRELYPTRTAAAIMRHPLTPTIEITGDAAHDPDGLLEAIGKVEEVLKTLL
jgi:hypothetical protein